MGTRKVSLASERDPAAGSAGHAEALPRGSSEQFWYRQDKPGVVFLINVDSLDAARAATSSLPLTAERIAEYEFMPLGPLAPLGMLIQGH
ncbi:hypothetical protein [Burkholderia plantarii]|uniref:hypothetical protein n=1 Tax=Burkholderia plantarii TaxID=41899 RepID=UPI00272D2C4D|nr:hypothetical protein [Burkholderia plantarii]